MRLLYSSCVVLMYYVLWNSMERTGLPINLQKIISIGLTRQTFSNFVMKIFWIFPPKKYWKPWNILLHRVRLTELIVHRLSTNFSLLNTFFINTMRDLWIKHIVKISCRLKIFPIKVYTFEWHRCFQSRGRRKYTHLVQLWVVILDRKTQ